MTPRTPNLRVNPPIQPVTGVAMDATPAPVRLAGYTDRWARSGLGWELTSTDNLARI